MNELNNDTEEIQELDFQEGPKEPFLEEKVVEIETKIKSGITLEDWREFALSPGGLVNDVIRKQGWPALLELDSDCSAELISEELLMQHPEYSQVQLDVNRSLKRFPPGIPIEQRLALQGQLTNLILRVISKYPHLSYYQGYHDVAITFLLVVGENVGLRIMEILSTNHLKYCMEPTMDKTSELLNYVSPLINRINPELCSHIEKSGVGTMYCLPWYITWFGHNLSLYKDVVRLYDAFLASPPLMPLYVSATTVCHRAQDLLKLEPDMAVLHCTLSSLPENLPFDEIVTSSVELYGTYPPSIIGPEAKEKTKLEKEERLSKIEKAQESRLGQHWKKVRKNDDNKTNGLKDQLVQMMPSSRTQFLLIAFSIAIGFYAYLRGNGSPSIR